MSERFPRLRIYTITAAAVVLIISFALAFRHVDSSHVSLPGTSTGNRHTNALNAKTADSENPTQAISGNQTRHALAAHASVDPARNFESVRLSASVAPARHPGSRPSSFTEFKAKQVVQNPHFEERKPDRTQPEIPDVKYVTSQASDYRVLNSYTHNNDFQPEVTHVNAIEAIPTQQLPLDVLDEDLPVDVAESIFDSTRKANPTTTVPAHRIRNPYLETDKLTSLENHAAPTSEFKDFEPQYREAPSTTDAFNPQTQVTSNDVAEFESDELNNSLVDIANEPFASLAPPMEDPATDFSDDRHLPTADILTRENPTIGSDDRDSVALVAAIHPQGPSKSTQGTTEYRLADQPQIGDRYKSETPIFDRCAAQTETFLGDFSPDPIDHNQPYDPYLNQQVYQGKQLNANQRPLLELGQPWYQLGQLSPGFSFLGQHNNVNPQLVVFGDYRTAIASNTLNGDNQSQIAWEMNTFWSLFVTGTERVVWGISPFDNGGGNTRWLLDDDRFEFEGDFDFDFGYLEGDLGAITGGFIGETLPFDLPFAAGLTPLFLQNGIWLNDALEGVFATLPARNSPALNISNMDITFAYVYDNLNSAAFEGDNSAAKAYAMFLFIEALNGYFEIDYAFLEDRDLRDRSYHNIGLAFTRRFGRFISHSTRVIANAGQDVAFGDQTADGVLLLSENSLITRNPYTVIPYFNFFAGFDTPQSFAGDQELVNTGILFESDGMTGYPTLDGRAQDTFGYAVGLNLLAQDFSQQLILETAAVFRGDDSDLNGDQYGVGARYQLPLTNSWIFRTDAMYGFFRGDDDDFGTRIELRKKF